MVARVFLGLSQQQLAEKASVGLGTIKRIEAAHWEIVGTAQTIDRIHRYLEPDGAWC
jgi:transcriptional regulator with XRE-family HTH domain